MKSLSSILPQILDSSKSDPAECSYFNTQIQRAWNRIVGDQIAQRAQPVRFKGSLLYVAVEAPEWFHPLQEISPQLLEKLNQATSFKISQIIFFQRTSESRKQKPVRETINHRPFASAQNRQQAMTNRQRWYNQISLNSQESQKINQELSQITDPELRELLSRIRVKAAKLEKLRERK